MWGTPGSGAGHGGQGGAGYYARPGGLPYDSATEPVDFGSGGDGNNEAGPNRGGGAIQLSIAGTLTIDGRVSANADAVAGSYDGGGAGGSVWLTASRLNGAGSITANGQAAYYGYSGAGAGGRIAIYTGVNEFAGAVAAVGGQGGLQNGSGGSLYYSTNVPPPMVIAQYPSGSVNRFVSYVDVTFNQSVARKGIMSPVLQEARGLGGDLPLVGIRKLPPLVHVLADCSENADARSFQLETTLPPSNRSARPPRRAPVKSVAPAEGDRRLLLRLQ